MSERMAPPHDRRARARVLVVTRNGSERDALSVLLDDEGFVVSSTASVEEAAALLPSHPGALLLLDGGFVIRDDVVEIVRSLRRTDPNLPVVLMWPGEPTDAEVVGLLREPLTAIVLKPIRFEGLVSVLDDLLARGEGDGTRGYAGAPVAADNAEPLVAAWPRRPSAAITDTARYMKKP